MNWNERLDQLTFSATFQQKEIPDNWYDVMTVPSEAVDHYSKLIKNTKYHLRMCFDLSLHLTLCEESPLFVTLNYMFNFALIELRHAELVLVNYQLEHKMIFLVTTDKKLLYVLSLSLFRIRETLYNQYKKVLGQRGRSVDAGDQPFAHHTPRQLLKQVRESLLYLTHFMEFGLKEVKGSQGLDQDFWEQVAQRLGFAIHMLNRVICDRDLHE